jgi:hypothetical protein
MKGDAEESQRVPEQGEVLAERLERLGAEATWFVITPFRAVAAKLRGRVGRRQPRGGAGRIGTIHTEYSETLAAACRTAR